MADVKKIFERLSRHVAEEADRRLNALEKPEDQSDQDFGRDKEQIRATAFRITVTIEGREGDSLFGDRVDLFTSPNLPENISKIFMTNIVAFENFSKSRPANNFTLHLDFSKPPLLDANTFVSSPTANVSNLTIEGERDSWIAAISEAVMTVVNSRKRRRAWLHAAFVYDFGLLIFSFPIGIYAAWRSSGFVQQVLAPISAVLSAAAYFYIMIAVAWAYRIFFGYTKWAFPTVELHTPNDSVNTHRKFWYVIVCGLLVQALWEIFRS
jgi:hypothetical protein